jgi:hypothetical protein
MESNRMKLLFYLYWMGFCLWSAPLTAQDQVPDPAAADRRIARAQFTTNIVDREPVDRVLIVSPPIAEVYFFTDIRHMEGDTATHSWRYRGELISQVSFEVRGPRWRVYSKVRLEPYQFGDWSVTVTDGNGWPLYTELFRYQPEQAGANASAGAEQLLE